MVERRVLQNGGASMASRVLIGYKLEPIYENAGGFATAAMLTSMISGEVISSSGGGSFCITPQEFKVLKENQGIKNLIKAEANKPVPKIIQVVVSMAEDAEYEGVITDLKAEGFHLHKRGVLGSTAFLVGEIYDTYLEKARNIHGVFNIQLKEDINF